MFYAGDTSDCALWETVLRDIVVPQAKPPHPIELPEVGGYHIARVRLKRDVEILDLGRFGVRKVAGDDVKRRDRITVLTAVPKYKATHKEAARLLSDFPRTGGLLWPSKQTGEDGTYLFYEPPLTADDFESIESIPLDSPEGMKLLDQALVHVGMRRLDSAALLTNWSPSCRQTRISTKSVLPERDRDAGLQHSHHGSSSVEFPLPQGGGRHLRRHYALRWCHNVGKTSLLDAIYAAMGAGRRTLSQDDVFVDATESGPPKDRRVTIDVLIRPVAEDGSVLEKFPNGSYCNVYDPNGDFVGNVRDARS